MFKINNYKKFADPDKSNSKCNQKDQWENDIRADGEQEQKEVDNKSDKNPKIKILHSIPPFLYNKEEFERVTSNLYGLKDIIIGITHILSAFFAVYIFYSISFQNFLFSFLNPAKISEIAGEKIHVYLFLIWTGWSFAIYGISNLFKVLLNLNMERATLIDYISLLIYFVPVTTSLWFMPHKDFKLLYDIIFYLIMWYKIFARRIFKIFIIF
jgi:hypothetical protein